MSCMKNHAVIFVQRTIYETGGGGGGGGGRGGRGGRGEGTDWGHKPTCMHSAIVPVLYVC